MFNVGDRVYAWCDIRSQIDTIGIRVNGRVREHVEVIGTVVETSDAFVTIDLVTFPDTRVSEDIDFVFPVGAGPVMLMEGE